MKKFILFLSFIASTCAFAQTKSIYTGPGGSAGTDLFTFSYSIIGFDSQVKNHLAVGGEIFAGKEFSYDGSGFFAARPYVSALFKTGKLDSGIQIGATAGFGRHFAPVYGSVRYYIDIPIYKAVHVSPYAGFVGGNNFGVCRSEAIILGADFGLNVKCKF